SRTTLEAQAELISNHARTAFSPIVPVREQERYPVSSSQRRLWVLSQVGNGNVAYNMPGAYLLEGILDEDALDHAFNEVVERHETIRTTFGEDEEGELRQHIHRSMGFGVVRRDLRYEDNTEEALNRLGSSAFSRPFDLEQGPLLRAELYRIGERRWVLVAVMHHIVSDGWSIGVLIGELLLLYRHRVGESTQTLPVL